MDIVLKQLIVANENQNAQLVELRNLSKQTYSLIGQLKKSNLLADEQTGFMIEGSKPIIHIAGEKITPIKDSINYYEFATTVSNKGGRTAFDFALDVVMLVHKGHNISKTIIAETSSFTTQEESKIAPNTTGKAVINIPADTQLLEEIRTAYFIYYYTFKDKFDNQTYIDTVYMENGSLERTGNLHLSYLTSPEKIFVREHLKTNKIY